MRIKLGNYTYSNLKHEYEHLINWHLTRLIQMFSFFFFQVQQRSLPSSIIPKFLIWISCKLWREATTSFELVNWLINLFVN